MHARNARHDGGDLFALPLESLQVVPENLKRKRTLGAGECFSDVVLNRLGKVPDRPWVFLHCPVHGSDQFLFVLTEYRAPLLLRLQVNEILGVAESSGVRSVVRPSDLRHHFAHLWERRENITAVVSEFFAFRKTRAVGQRATCPNRAFIQMRQELRPNDTAKAQINCSSQGGHGNASDNPTMLNGPAQMLAVKRRQIIHHWVVAFPDSLAEKCACKNRCDENRERQSAEKSKGDRPRHGSE